MHLEKWEENPQSNRHWTDLSTKWRAEIWSLFKALKLLVKLDKVKDRTNVRNQQLQKIATI